MDPKILFISLNRTLDKVKWDRYGEHVYAVIGDGITFDPAAFQLMLDSAFGHSPLLVSIDRRTAFCTESHTSAGDLLTRMGPACEAMIVDIQFRKILQIHENGVARMGTAPFSLRASLNPAPIQNKPCDSENSV